MSEASEKKNEHVDSQASSSEDEVRSRLEEELKRLKAGDVALQSCVTLLNLGYRRLGLTKDTEPERDLEQVSEVIELVRSVQPALEKIAPTEAGQLREALSQLQLKYVAELDSAPEKGGSGGQAEESLTGSDESSPTAEARQSKKLWTPPGA